MSPAPPAPARAPLRVTRLLHAEATGGLLLIAGAVVALVWANTPWADGYQALRDLRLGPAALGLDLTLGTWAADGLLAVFFFVVGLELKRELVIGDLRDPRRAVLPMAAAFGGMVVPALIYVAWNLGPDGALAGWAIPTATDIAFALAILAVVGTHLPAGLRTFLLTLAVVDDLLAITVIALFYPADLDPAALALAVLAVAAFGFLVRRRALPGWALLPLAVLAWALVHESGVHATVAGVLLALTVPVRPDARYGETPSGPGRAERLEHLVRPVSAGFAVPVFAFFAAGVTVGGASGLADSLRDPVALGVVCGLVVGKTVGIAGTTWLLSALTPARLDDELARADVLGLSMLAGTGFTVSLLIGELAFGADRERADHATVGVLVGSLLAVAAAGVVLGARNRVHRRRREVAGDPHPGEHRDGS